MAQLTARGAPSDRAAALVFHGTTALQRIVTGTLSSIADLAAQNGIESPALLMVGDVVSLATELSWFSTAAAAELSRSA